MGLLGVAAVPVVVVVDAGAARDVTQGHGAVVANADPPPFGDVPQSPRRASAATRLRAGTPFVSCCWLVPVARGRWCWLPRWIRLRSSMT